MGRRANPLRLSEADIEQTCSDYLAIDGWRSLKTDPVSDKSRGKGFGELGMPDRLYIRYDFPYALEDDPGLIESGPVPVPLAAIADVLWIEWKSATGRAEQHQIDWHTAERARGALVLLAGVDFPATIEGFLEWYRGSGLMRRAL